MYNAFDFDDGLDLINKLKADVVLVTSDYEFLSRSMLMAARHNGIATVVLLSMGFNFGY